MTVLATIQPKSFTTNLGIDLSNETTTSQPILTNTSDTIFYAPTADDQINQFNTSTSEETTNAEDQAYVVPIKVILHTEHVHQDPNDNGTFLKFNYILLRTNETAYHGHFATDEEAERLSLLKAENETNIPLNNTTADNDEEEHSSSTTNASPMNVLINQIGDQYDEITEQTIVNEQGVVVGRFNEISWKRPNDREVAGQQNVNDNTEINERAMSSESDQENDRHYSQILQWIHFNL